MDFLLFYSKYSENCAVLFQEIPLLNDKAICIDSSESRRLLKALPYALKRVPTLFVTDGISKIIKVLEGIREIRNWFLLVTYSMSPQPDNNAPEQLEEEFHNGGVDDMLPPRTEAPEMEYSSLKGVKTEGVRGLAEELQRERESFIETTEPNKGGSGGGNNSAAPSMNGDYFTPV